MPKGSLFKSFILPPFSVLDSRSGMWKKRKKQWIEWGGFAEDKSRDSLVWDPKDSPKDGHQRICKVGTLLEFDPLLAEIILRWFAPPKGKILDPFASGLRGLVASQLGYNYIGIELRQEQVNIARNKAQSLNVTPSYIVGNSLIEVPKLQDEFDFVFSCPPYYNLEKYSDNPNDLSNYSTYEEFNTVYRNIINLCTRKLKTNRFACFVVGNMRDKNGFYRNFVSDTIKHFVDSGLHLYNDMILINVVGSVSLRVNKPFGLYRKVGKLHQNVLVFYKGNNCKDIKKDFPEIETEYIIQDNQSTLF